MKRAPRTLVVDVGASGIKAMVLDTNGKALAQRLRRKTPRPATPEAVLELIGRLADRSGEFDRVSIGFPGVVRGGTVKKVANLDPSWAGQSLEKLVQRKLGKPVRTANDAIVHGLSVISGKGVELVLTLGTGLGAALFVEGRPLPCLDLAHHPFKAGRSYEGHLGTAALRRDGHAMWNKVLREAIEKLRDVFYFDALFLGGGNARSIRGDLPENVRIVSNRAGLLGGVVLWKAVSRPW